MDTDFLSCTRPTQSLSNHLLGRSGTGTVPQPPRFVASIGTLSLQEGVGTLGSSLNCGVLFFVTSKLNSVTGGISLAWIADLRFHRILGISPKAEVVLVGTL